MKSITDYQKEFYSWKTRTENLPDNASLCQLLDCKMDGVWLVIKLLGRASILAAKIVADRMLLSFILSWKWLKNTIID